MSLYVKPAREGLRVRLPWRPASTVPDAGMEVPDNRFIRRRIAKGDLVTCDPPKRGPRPARTSTPAPPTTDTPKQSKSKED